jgi:hypothetical protein
MNIRIAGRGEISQSALSRHDIASIRLGGLAAVAGGVLMVGHEVVDLVIGGRTTDAPRALLHTAWLAALFLTVRGVGILQRPGLDRVGRWLVRIALVGVGAQTVAAAVEAVGLIYDPTPSAGDPSLPVLVVLIAVLVALVVGLLAFSVSIIRAGVLPRLVGLLVLAGVLVKMLAPEPVPSLAIFGLAVVWLGVHTLRAVLAAAASDR